MLSLACRSGTSSLATIARQIHCGRCVSSLYNAPPSALQQQAQKLGREELRVHYERIAATTRPISPHLGIYKMESHMFMSLMNRATGCYLACAAIGFGGISLVMPDWFTQSSLLLSSVNPLFTTFIKFCVAFPFAIHLGNGLRHFAHDFGYLLGRNQITSTQLGTFIFAVALGTGLALYTIK